MHDEDEQVECDDDDEEKYDDNEVNDEKGDTVSSSHIDGGGNAPEVALEFKSNDDFIENKSGLELKSNDDLIEALIEIERRGMKIPKTQEERIELITKHHLFGHFGRDAVCKSLIRDGYWWRGMRKQITKELSNCNACARFTVVREGYNPSGSISAEARWYHLQIDTSVHLPAAPGG